jgi:peroxiredoxin Q/BCP
MTGLKYAVLILFLVLGPRAAAALEAGEKAPPFEAESTMGTVRLTDYGGKKMVLLAFYFKDFTAG